MQTAKIERLFADFIINELGPSEEKEKIRNTKYDLVKHIIENALILNYPDYIPHIFVYGSFYLKTYLKDSDIDITIILEKKENHEIIKDASSFLINNILQIIKKSFEDYNNKMKLNIFSDINIILSDVNLLKCQIETIPLDISLNNFYGLLKLFYIDYIFKKVEKYYQKSTILKRSILLIKAWCYYEGNLIGSNIGLMASCALELLTINIFNTHYKNINNEIDAFFYFFNFINTIDFNNSIMTLFGPITKTNFFNDNENINKNDPLWYMDKNGNKEYLFNLEEFIQFMKNLYKSKTIFYPNEQKKNLFQDKFFNIMDPINENNNLGKSINYHSFSRMKGVFQYMKKEINKINTIKQLGDPFLYINYLLKLFNTSLSMNFIELFINYLNMPKIYIFSQNKEHCEYNLLKVDKNEIMKFNKLFNYEQNEKDEEEKKEKNEEEEEEGEEEGEEDDDNEEKIDIEKIKNIKNINIKYQKFDIIINNKIINRLFDINHNYGEQTIFYDKLNKVTDQYFLELNEFMKNYKFI